MKLVAPKTTPYEIKRGQRGIKVWAVQRAVNHLMPPAIAEDGVFAGETEALVRAYQGRIGLKVDGVFGELTSNRVADALVEMATPSVLPGLVRGILQLESGGLIAAVNWNTPGGVDCGYMQRRVYDPATERKLKNAFDALKQINATAMRLSDRFMAFANAGSADWRWRLAALDHNYPLAATTIATTGIERLAAYYTTPQAWVEAIGAKFPDGEAVQTPLEWCQHYALGSDAHNDPGLAMAYVQPLD